jgi:hypothetical protein
VSFCRPRGKGWQKWRGAHLVKLFLHFEVNNIGVVF